MQNPRSQKENTVIVGGEGKKKTSRQELPRSKPRLLKPNPILIKKKKLQERLAKLAGGVAVIRVGAPTETEMKDKKFRMEDALNATRAAVEEGIIAGGGSAYIHAADSLNEVIDSLTGDEKTGAEIVQKALESRFTESLLMQEKKVRSLSIRCVSPKPASATMH